MTRSQFFQNDIESLAIIQFDKDQIITNWNSQAEKIFGYKKKEMLGTKGEKIAPTKALQHELQTTLDTTQTTNTSIKASITLQHKDGSLITLNWHATPLIKEDEGYITAFIEDITRQETQEKDLERVMHQNELILSTAGEGIFGLDKTGNVTFINNQALNFLGFTKAELMGKNMHELTHYKKPNGKRYERKDCPIYSAFSDGKTHQGSDECFIKKNGELFPVEYTSTPLREGSTHIGAVVTFRDISKRLEREKALKDSEERYRTVISALHEGVMLQTMRGELKTFNKRAEEIFGLSAEQMEGKQAIDKEWYAIKEDGTPLQGEDHPAMLTLRTGKPVENIVIGIHKPTGEINWINVNAQPIIPPGETHPTEIVSSFNDITAEKIAREEMESLNQQLQRSNKELQDFASVASHDLQEPLRKIQAFGNRLMVKYASVLPPEGADYIARMENASIRMQTLINDLLTFSRVTTKAQPFTKVRLSDIAKEVLVDLEIAIEQSGAKITLQRLPAIEADPLQMRQLFQNLIGNALKFRKKETAPLIIIGSDAIVDDENFVRLFIKDNGIGFEEKYLDKIFNVFQKLHSATEYAGSGVGLAVCRKIVERHGGSITAKSVPNKGTTFFIMLPKKQKEEVKTVG